MATVAGSDTGKTLTAILGRRSARKPRPPRKQLAASGRDHGPVRQIEVIGARWDYVDNMGDVILVEGPLSVEKDFGAGYFYKAIIESAKVTTE